MTQSKRFVNKKTEKSEKNSCQAADACNGCQCTGNADDLNFKSFQEAEGSVQYPGR